SCVQCSAGTAPALNRMETVSGSRTAAKKSLTARLAGANRRLNPTSSRGFGGGASSRAASMAATSSPVQAHGLLTKMGFPPPECFEDLTGVQVMPRDRETGLHVRVVEPLILVGGYRVKPQPLPAVGGRDPAGRTKNARVQPRVAKGGQYYRAREITGAEAPHA